SGRSRSRRRPTWAATRRRVSSATRCSRRCERPTPRHLGTCPLPDPGQAPDVALRDAVMRVVYAGQDGSHAEAACERLFPDNGDSLAVSTFAAVVAAVEAGEAERGLLAIESSVAGPVSETHDL